MSHIELLFGETIEMMSELPDGSIDLIYADLPYGTTKNPWDVIIPFNLLWGQYLRIAKPNAAIVLHGQDKFTAKLMLSQEKYHRYNLVWDKVLKNGHLNANKMPMRQHEDICVFYRKLPTYNPQKTIGDKKNNSKAVGVVETNNNYGHYRSVDNSKKLGVLKHPTSILKFSKPHPSKCLHPTQKPIDLADWIIKTYSNEGDWVLDNTMGSGTAGESCKINNRNFIGIDNDVNNFTIAKNRING